MISKPPGGKPGPPQAEGGLSSGALPSPGPDGFDEAHRALLADRSIQFDLPAHEPTPPPEWLRWLIEWMGQDHPVLRILLWGLAGAAALLILWLILRWLMGADWPWRRRGADSADEAGWRPQSAPALALLGEADALAGRGLFSEAAHLLLFRSIADIGTRRPGLVGPSLTSRDISGLEAIPPAPRGAFARIAAAVERSLFARRPLGAEDWRECRAAYEAFAFADGWRG